MTVMTRVGVKGQAATHFVGGAVENLGETNRSSDTMITR